MKDPHLLVYFCTILLLHINHMKADLLLVSKWHFLFHVYRLPSLPITSWVWTGLAQAFNVIYFHASRYKPMWNDDTLKTLLSVSRSLLQLYFLIFRPVQSICIYFFFLQATIKPAIFPNCFLLQNYIRKSFKFLLLETKAELLGRQAETTTEFHIEINLINNGKLWDFECYIFWTGSFWRLFILLGFILKVMP